MFSRVYFPYTLVWIWMSNSDYFMFWIPPFLVDVLVRICIYFYHINFHYVVIRSSFRGENRVWSWNKLVWWIRWWEYVIHSSSILARSLHACTILTRFEPTIQKDRHINWNRRNILLCPLAIMTTDSHSPAKSLASVYSLLFKYFITSTFGIGFPISS